MDPIKLKESTDEITNVTVPMILKGIADDVAAITSAVAIATDKFVGVANSLIDTVIPAFADGVSQVLGLAQRFANGIYFESDPINIPPIRFKVWSPMIPTGDEKK